MHDIFLAHPTCVKLFKKNSTFFVMNSTYKTNMCMMPLFEIVGVTSTDMTYFVGFGIFTAEKENNFILVLQMLLKLLNSKSDMRKVVVTDRDTTLMNVVATVLPETTAILCYFMLIKMLESSASLTAEGNRRI